MKTLRQQILGRLYDIERLKFHISFKTFTRDFGMPDNYSITEEKILAHYGDFVFIFKKFGLNKNFHLDAIEFRSRINVGKKEYLDELLNRLEKNQLERIEKLDKEGLLEETFLGSKLKMVGNSRQVLQMPNSVNFVILTKDNYVLLAAQYRASTQTETINAFGGYIDEGETIEEAIMRECFEESNIQIVEHEIDFIYKDKLVSAGYTTEKNSLAVINLDKKYAELNPMCNDAEEGINIVKVYLTELDTLGELEGLKVTLALDYLK